MSKLKNPLLSLGAVGRLARAITFARRRRVNIAESTPIPKDARSLAQLSWRHMYQKAVALWHALSAAERQEWESLARAKHMTGYAWFISQALKPNPGLYLPLQGGTMTGDIDMAKNRLLKLPAPTDSQEVANKAYADAPETTQTKGARVYKNAHTDISHGTYTVVDLTQERYDTDAMHWPALFNSRLTCRTAGKYFIAAGIRWFGNATGQRIFYIRLNGSIQIAYDRQNNLDINPVSLSVATIYALNVNDYVEMVVWQNTGGDLSLRYDAQYSPEFMMQRIG